MSPAFYVLAALAMSAGWGIRGQFGHEYGAAVAGALVGLAIATLTGREDWTRRLLHFAVYAGIGWSFGGSMSYMKAITYAHASDGPTLLYGFACVFLIGFLWAAPGGAGLALPAVLSRDDLRSGYVTICAVLAAWYLQDLGIDVFRPSLPSLYDSDYIGVTVALLAALGVALARRRLDPVTSLAIHMAAGWWIAFSLLVLVAGFRMSPPRGDSWAGCLGLVAGILVWARSRPAIALATWVTGFLGGIGFALGQAIKLMFIATGWHSNWHSVMEQTQGLLHGVAAAVAMAMLARRLNPEPSDATGGRDPRWIEIFAVVFTLVLIPYVNMRKSPADWVTQISGFTEWMYGIAATGWLIPSKGFIGWLELLFLALTLAIALIVRRREHVAFIPAPARGKGQLLFLALLWSVVFINALYVLPRWQPDRLVTEWLIAINAVACTAIVALAEPAAIVAPAAVMARTAPAPIAPLLRKAIAAGLAASVLTICAGYGIRRALFGHAFTGHIKQEHVRFGPNNTNTIK